MESNKISEEEKLSRGNIWKLIFTMGFPVLIAQIVNMLYNIVDRIYIGHIEVIGSDALTGLGVCNPIIMFVSAFAAFAGFGGAPLASIAMGKGDRRRAEKILGNATFMIIVFSVILTAVFMAVKKPFLELVGASEVTYPYADEYISIYLLGTLFVQVSIGLNSFITAQGKSRTAMFSVLIGAITNIILDPIFIFAFDMGVKGAAIATVISQLFSALWVFLFLASDKSELRIRAEYLKPDIKVIGSVMALGVSPFIMQSTEALISIVLNSGLQKYGGDLYVGSLTILQSVMQFITTPINGFTQGVQPIMSYNFGAGNKDRVIQTFKRMTLLVVSVSFVIALSTMLFPSFYASLFTENRELIALVDRVMPIFMCGMLIFGIQLSCQTAFMALGQAKISLFVALLRKVILLIPFALIFPIVMGGDVMGIYIAEPAADIIAVICCLTLFLLNIRKILEKGA